MAATGWHAFVECCFSPRRYWIKLLAVPMVPNLVLYPVDSYICHLPMDDPFLRLNLVAISISRLVIPLCSNMVLIGGSAPPSMLCHLCIDRKDEILLPVKMVSSVMPVFKVNRGFRHHWCHNLFDYCHDI
eukprot:TRINITY_DN2241_c0_g2_i7.p1 TRINITY_DN2241_c0_g2~~TRINITY_DN2241_c0_g2_i7.p1  ORF type:complete len:130 (+),score=11.56 TRINITY_DN2241_c0_g2_i7:996-1385(+)